MSLENRIISHKKNIGSPELYYYMNDVTDDEDIMHQTSMYNRKANAVLSDCKHCSGDLRIYRCTVAVFMDHSYGYSCMQHGEPQLE